MILAENYVYGDLQLLLDQYPRFVPSFAPKFLQTFIVKRIKTKLSNQAKAQGIGRHSRYLNSYVCIQNSGYPGSIDQAGTIYLS